MKNAKVKQASEVLITWNQIKQLIKVPPANLNEYLTDGNFPAPAKFGDGPALWSRADVIFWLQEVYDRTKTQV